MGKTARRSKGDIERSCSIYLLTRSVPTNSKHPAIAIFQDRSWARGGEKKSGGGIEFLKCNRVIKFYAERRVSWEC